MSNTYLSSVSYNYSNNGITDQDHVKSIKSDIESVIESIARAICDKDITTVDKVIDYLDNYKQNYKSFCARPDFGSAGNCDGAMPLNKFIERIHKKLSVIPGIPPTSLVDMSNLLTPGISNVFLNDPDLSRAQDIIQTLAGDISDKKPAIAPALHTSKNQIAAVFNAPGAYATAVAAKNIPNVVNGAVTDAAAKPIATLIATALVDELELIKTQHTAKKTIFKKDTIKEIVEEMQKDDLFKKSCKFKRGVVNDRFGSVRLSSIATWPRYARYSRIMNNGRVYVVPGTFLRSNLGGGGLVGNILTNGDDESKELLSSDDSEGLGVYVDLNNNMKPIKYVDFDDFIDGYEEYHLKNNIGKINVKVCKLNPKSKKIECKQFSDKINLNDGDSSDSEYNVNTHGVNKEYENAYKILKIFRNSNDIEELVDNLRYLVHHIKYYVLPIKTFEKAKIVHNKIKNRY